MSSLEPPTMDFDTDFHTDWEDYAEYAADAALPTPGDTPYTRTPAMSRRPSRGPSPAPSGYRNNSSSPPPIPGRGKSPRRQPSMTHMRGREGPYDENISILDPRRFTPTLHANLVAEILSLRRELESKNNFIDTLEHDLAAAKTEYETTQVSAATALKEARDAKRQLARAENDDPASQIAKERDEAVETITEMKKQVERLTLSRRKAEEELERMRKIHERDTEKAEEARRTLERRAHVAEGRLKAVLDEIAAANERPETRATMHSRTQSKDFSQTEDSGSDTGSIRTLSVRNRPMSLDMGDDEAERLGISLNGAMSLAAELDFGAGSGSDTAEADTASEESAAEDDVDDGAETDLEPEHDNPDDETTPGMVSDTESVQDVDELPEVEVVEIGVQVVPETEETDYAERIVTLEGLLKDKTAEIQKVYTTLDEKAADLDAAYEALDKANNKIAELEDEMEGMEEKAAKAFEVFQQKEADFTARVETFEARHIEFEDKVTTLDQRSALLNEKESRLQEEALQLNHTQAKIKDQTLKLDEREKELDGREKKLEDREKLLPERAPSPPPLAIPKEMKSVAERLSMFESKPKDTEYEANIRRKRASGVASPPSGRAASPKPFEPVYVSVEMQTQPLEPPSPPVTPSPPSEPEIEMVTASTQTDPVKATPPPVIHVPGIFISPPEPTPPLPRPLMKDAITQTKIVGYKNTSMQTQEIRLDERLRKFAPHLIPANYKPKSILVDTSVGESNSAETTDSLTPVLPRRSSKRISPRRTNANQQPPVSAVFQMPIPNFEEMNTDSPNHMDELSSPVSAKKRVSKNIFGRDSTHTINTLSSGEEDFVDGDYEYHTALSAPRPRRQKSAKGLNSVPTLAQPFVPFKKQPSIRKNAIVASGVDVHSRNRVASDGSGATNDSGKIGPPFPVPTRHSSRRPGYFSDRTSNASPPTRVPRGHRRHGYQSSTSTRRSSVRKSRSGPQLSIHKDSMSITRSPQTFEMPPGSTESPEVPPLPRDEITTPGFNRSRFGHGRNKYDGSNMTSATGQTSNASVIQQTSVVDAIAQTMVGEWMWKYVRRRRSFGVSDAPQVDVDAGGQRHKRWVWLAPYERAVMWSSRQPTSGSALLGKSGRKRKRSILHPGSGGGLVDSFREALSGPFSVRSVPLLTPVVHKVLIQSVLDVKDDTPLPKGASLGPGAQPAFNRSILILTPARALKFTASSLERHYVWLTALSFLSHSAGDNPDGLLSLPPPMPFEYEQMEQQSHRSHALNERRNATSPLPPPPPPPPPANSHRKPMGLIHRDSVRVTKNRSRMANNNSPIPPMPAIPPSIPRQPHQNHQYKPSIANTVQSEESVSAALPPSIPRFPGHSRRRSNSAIHLPRPRTSDRESRPGFPHTGSCDEFHHPSPTFHQPGVVGGIGITSPNSSIFHGMGSYSPLAGLGHSHVPSTSTATSSWDLPSSTRDLGGAMGPSGMGTVRMEAFISVDRRQCYEFNEADEADDTATLASSRPSAYHLRRDRRSSRNGSYWSVDSDLYGGNGGPNGIGMGKGPSSTAGSSNRGSLYFRDVGDEEFWRNDDPFRGF